MNKEIPERLRKELFTAKSNICLHNIKVIEKVNMESTPRGRVDYTVCAQCGEILKKRIWR